MNMKWSFALLAAWLATLPFVPAVSAQRADRPGLSIEQRGRVIFEAMESTPVNAAALGEALRDIGHVEATYHSPPLKKWTDGAQVIDGRIHLKTTVGLNRGEGGEAPPEWVEKLTAPLQKELRLVTLKLAFAPPAEVAAERDRLLAHADRKLRAGLRELAKTYPQLHITNWGTLEEALAGRSPAGRISIWVGRYHGGSTGIQRPVPKELGYNVFVLLRPLHWPVPPGQWAMHPMYSRLALMGQAYADAGDPSLRAELKKLVADALAPLERLDDRAAGRTTATAPATQPATAPAAAP